ncbi:hypothetical protein A9Z40_02950 [Microbacterium arborescens]|uniref:Uncharacterized protein n=1 Tax=Microbacterium arborescens TaxID=33883 RepID=A0ABX2WII6_9MICO|nr:hypothetical protein A9Z40_02950 [Microbacterium arborescens]
MSRSTNGQLILIRSLLRMLEVVSMVTTVRAERRKFQHSQEVFSNFLSYGVSRVRMRFSR